MSDFAAPKVQAPVSGSHVASQWGGGEMDGMEGAPLVQGPEAAHLSQLQAAANQSPQVQQFRQLQAGIDQSGQVQQFHKHQQGINNAVSQRKENRTGLPDDLKSGIEGLSGMSMDDVRVHYNSDKPAAMQAHAFAQGSEIHVAAGQEQHLPHEAWHVVQQKQGRVKPTAQLKQAPINDDDALEREADVMGAKALSAAGTSLPVADGGSTANEIQLKSIGGSPAVVQRKMGIEFETGIQAFDMGKFSDKLARSKESPVEKPTYTPDDLSLKSESKEGAKKYFHENFGVQQDRTMWKGNGIQIDSDNSKLEFVTEPAVPFDEFEAPLKELAKTADSLPGQLDACAPIDQVLTNGKNQGPYYLVPYPFKKLTFGKVTGSPQITLGIPYSKLFDFMEFLSKYEMQASMRLHGRQAENVENNLPELDKWANDESVNEEEGKRRKKKAGERKNTFHDSLNSEKEKGFRAIENAEVKNFIDISGKVKSILHQALEKDEELSKLKIDPAEEAKLRGILHMTGQYAQYACDYKGYKYKKIAFPVLMRTSFAALFQALSKQAQQVFVKTAPALVNEMGLTEGVAFLGHNDPFKIMDWVASISNPQQRQVKPITKEYKDFTPETEEYGDYLDSLFVPSDIMTAPGAFNGKGHETDKSMGAFDKLDSDKHSDELVVVELRHIFHFVDKELHSFTPEIVAEFMQDIQEFSKQGFFSK